MIDWNIAPPWAKFAAMDHTSEWYWYDERPTWREDIQAWETRGNFDPVDMTDWARDSVLERPSARNAQESSVEQINEQLSRQIAAMERMANALEWMVRRHHA
jgi:hypothetical protein